MTTVHLHGASVGLATHPRSSHVAWRSLGRLAYDDALLLQNDHAERLLADRGEPVVFAVEHPPTVTIGRSGSYTHIIASRADIERVGLEIREVDRGGDVTYHGPGQLVLYPVLRLGAFDNDIRRYVRMLEQVAIDVLGEVGITADRRPGYPGVWVNDDKICAIGVRARRRSDGEFVTTHGMALNITTDLSHFGFIVPCGLVDKGVTSVAKLLGQDGGSLAAWETRCRDAFGSVFGVQVKADQGMEAGVDK